MLWAEILTTVTLSAVLRLMALKQMNNPSVTLTMKIWLFIIMAACFDVIEH